ncbi:MAG TPA: carboxypeptidase-like regulatory domain-containing protein, partial [Prolixibacteraceae bacterium]|nr:carboxypeptidase-like regulatory domain-containing protein [Prolixibacteraceae bacterium]
MSRVVIVILSMCISLSVFGQRYSVSGIISDAQTGETLVGASVLLKDSQLKGTTSNENGFFTLAGILTPKVEIAVSFVGYESQLRSIDFVDENKVFIEIKLHPSKVLLNEINVVEEGVDKLGDREIEISRHSLTPKVIQSIPTARNDVFKAIR